MSKNDKTPTHDAYRDSRTGQFVTERHAARHPATTEHERYGPKR
jgi:hypothetical protein